MSAFTTILTFICLVDLHISAQVLQIAESIGERGELFANKNHPQISQRFEGSSRSNYGQGGYSGSGRSSYVGSSNGRSGEYGRPRYGQFGYSSDGYGEGESYGHGSYGVGNYGKRGLRNGGYEQSAHGSYGSASYGGSSIYGQIPSYGDDYVGDSHVESDTSEPSIKSIAKVYLNHFVNKFIRGKSTFVSAAENVGSAHISDYQSYQAPLIRAFSETHSYPLTTPQIRYGRCLLISCTPSRQVAPR